MRISVVSIPHANYIRFDGYFLTTFFSWFDFSKNVWSVSNSFCCKAIFVPHFLVEYVELHICALYDLPVRRQRGSSRPFVGGVKLHFQKYVTSAAVWCIGGIFRKKSYTCIEKHVIVYSVTVQWNCRLQINHFDHFLKKASNDLGGQRGKNQFCLMLRLCSLLELLQPQWQKTISWTEWWQCIQQ